MYSAPLHSPDLAAASPQQVHSKGKGDSAAVSRVKVKWMAVASLQMDLPSGLLSWF